MFLVKSSGFNVHLRDAGDGQMKKVTPAGTLFHKAPIPDPVIEISEISASEAKTHAEKLDTEIRAASIKALADKVELAQGVVAAAKSQLEVAEEKVDAALLALKKAEQELAAGEESLDVKAEKPAPAAKSADKPKAEKPAKGAKK